MTWSEIWTGYSRSNGRSACIGRSPLRRGRRRQSTSWFGAAGSNRSAGWSARDGWPSEPPQALGVAQQLQSAPGDGIVRRLAGVESDGPLLSTAADAKYDVDLSLRAAGESGAECSIEGIGH